jgi:hypothetical protein
MPPLIAAIEFADWNRLLLTGELLVVVAGMALIFGRTNRDRVLALGIMSQGIVMMLAAGSAYFPRADLAVAAIAFLCLGCVWCAWSASRTGGWRGDNTLGSPPFRAGLGDESSPSSRPEDVS